MNDTIAAISTPIGLGGIGVIRLSGSRAFEIAEQIFIAKNKKSVKNQKSHSLAYGTIVENSIVVDEVLLTKMVAPNTYTKEDIVEINCHGGGIVTQKVLELVLMCGARLAEPGEFTKRAFLNGRIDLTQAEAVIDIITAKTEVSQKQAAIQLSGALLSCVKSLRDDILSLIAGVEASIDYPENDIDTGHDELKNSAITLLNKIQTLIDTEQTGKIIRDGITTVILGKPNVGKSSLLNTLLEEERAIVTDIPGTTRDVLEEFISVKGVPLKIIDTAGIRNSSDVIEQIGIEKAKKSVQIADLILLMFDASQFSSPSFVLSDEDLSLLDMAKDKKVIVIFNKVDLINEKIHKTMLSDYIDDSHIISMSLKTNEGIDILKNIITNMFFSGSIDVNDARITKMRHKTALTKAMDSLKNVIEACDISLPLDLISIDLIDSYKYLGEITGESLDDDIIDKIFSEFCLGK